LSASHPHRLVTIGQGADDTLARTVQPPAALLVRHDLRLSADVRLRPLEDGRIDAIWRIINL
jgi:hypothetical protein